MRQADQWGRVIELCKNVPYHALWTLAVLSCSPALPFPRAKRLRRRIAPRLPAAPPPPGCFWVHALSVGEVLSAVPLVRRLAEVHPERPRVLTVTTEQGWEVAQREMRRDADLMLPMPLDFWAAYRRLIRFLRPAVYIPVETDLWPGLIRRLGADGVPTVVVNGRVSPRTAAGYRRLGPLSRLLLEGPALWLMQSDLDARRIVEGGAPRERVRTAGNIKFDAPWEPMGEGERLGLLQALGLDRDDAVWVAGSTHPGEEDAILEAFRRLRGRFPRLRLVLAPRRVERAGEVIESARARGLRAAARSGGDRGRREAPVVVLDTLGELGRVYGVASFAFVGGSLVPVGGHNLLEPARFGLPVLFGPHTHNFAAMSAMLLEAGGGRRVDGENALEQAVAGLLAHPGEAREMGGRALAFVRSNTGSLGRVLRALEERMAHGA